MNLRALRTLIELEDAGGFAVAADRLGLTASAVSLQMKTLEQELRIDLFDRSNRPPTLTPAGRRVATHARRMTAEANAIRAVADEDGALHGDYRIGFVATASVRLMPSFLARARRRHPKARIRVEIDLSTALVRALLTGALDAAVITRTADLEQSLDFTALADEVFALAAPSALRARTLQECAARAPLVQFTPSTGIGALVADHLRREGVTPREVVELASVEAVMGCVNAGVGFAILPEPDVERYRDATVTATPLAAPGLGRELGLALRTGGPLAEQRAALIELFEPA